MSGCLDCGTGEYPIGKRTLPDGKVVELFICDWCYEYFYINSDGKLVNVERTEVLAR